ncbi:hypothetical protein Tco_0291753 [Tanacetum coccineum]
MSDYEDSTVTYTAVSSPYEDSSDKGSPGAEGSPMMLEDPHAYVVAIFQALPSPNYVPGPKEPEQAPPSHVYLPYVPEPVYPEYMPPEDDVLPAEEQPLPAVASPTTEGDDGDDDDPTTVAFPVDQDPSDEEIEPFETDESATTPPSLPYPTYRVTARMFI